MLAAISRPFRIRPRTVLLTFSKWQTGSKPFMKCKGKFTTAVTKLYLLSSANGKCSRSKRVLLCSARTHLAFGKGWRQNPQLLSSYLEEKNGIPPLENSRYPLAFPFSVIWFSFRISPSSILVPCSWFGFAGLGSWFRWFLVLSLISVFLFISATLDSSSCE